MTANDGADDETGVGDEIGVGPHPDPWPDDDEEVKAA